MIAERLVAAGAELAEGPLALPDGGFAWVDILAGRVHHADLDGNDAVVATTGEPVGALAPVAGGGLLGACMSGLRRVDLDGGGHDLLAPLPPRGADVRMNDGKADPAGRFVGGTMTLGTPRPGAGSLWSFGPEGTRELVGDLTISNGLVWSADGSTLFHIDTPTHRVDAFDYDVATGEVSGRRPHIVVSPDDGDPDGMCIDVEGGLWVALWGGGVVRRYVDGRLDDVVEIPTPHVTCPAFVGPGLDHLVITSAIEPYGDDAPPGAGDLYVVRPGVTGPPPAEVTPFW